VYPRKSNCSARASLVLVFASFSVSPIRVITPRVQFSASVAKWMNLDLKGRAEIYFPCTQAELVTEI